jgi:plastocyanin
MKPERKFVRALALWTSVMVCAQAMNAQTPIPQTATVRGRVEVVREAKPDKAKPDEKRAGEKRKSETKGRETFPSTVVWLTAVPGAGVELDPPAPLQGASARLAQKNKSFEPHVLVAPAGSMVEFPNRDPFFHNVFSLFEGKRFDLGLYEAGTTRMVRFDRPGISYIFCNIHPQMSAVVITMSTPLYATANADGVVSIANVPYGRYLLHIWSEGMGPENEKPMTREITIGDNATSLGVIRVPEANGQRMAHKNKYGREYDEPTPDSSIYKQQ